ncbi:MAG: hypothetical protein CVU72_05255, partial [Deltaproteobacteria bacterium HGW-Deltaproteobacteria-7]
MSPCAFGRPVDIGYAHYLNDAQMAGQFSRAPAVALVIVIGMTLVAFHLFFVLGGSDQELVINDGIIPCLDYAGNKFGLRLESIGC